MILIVCILNLKIHFFDQDEVNYKKIAIVSGRSESPTSSMETPSSTKMGGPPPTTKITRRQWVAIGILTFVNLINYMDRSTVAGMLEHIKQDKDFNITHDKYLGLLQTAFVVCYMIFAPVFGYFGDRYNRKLLLTVGISFWSLSTL